jgi:hypothetical protein
MRLPKTRIPAILLLAAICGASAAAAAPTGQWLTGRGLDEKLAEPITVEWSEAPLKRAIADLARAHRVGLLLDRRVDPERSVTLAVKATPLAGVCDQLAASAGIGFCRLGPLGYFGPGRTCNDLPTVAALRDEDVAHLPSAARIAWSRASAGGWPDFATPRELVEQLAQAAGAQVEGLGQVPHDLWAAADLPPLTVAQRLTLVAAQFDLAIEILDDGRAVRLIPWPERPTIERTYSAGTRARELAEQWAALAPRSQLRVEGTKVVVRGPLEDQQRIAARGKTSTRPAQPKRPAGIQVYTLKLEAVPLDRLLAKLGQQLDLQFEIDQPAVDRAKIDMRQNVSLKVEQATLDQLLAAALKPAGLTFVRQGTKVRVRPSEK